MTEFDPESFRYPVTQEDAPQIAHEVNGKLVEEIDPVDPEIKHYAINIAVANGVERAHIGDTIFLNFETGHLEIEKA
jgi:hypothetical protein